MPADRVRSTSVSKAEATAMGHQSHPKATLNSSSDEVLSLTSIAARRFQSGPIRI